MYVRHISVTILIGTCIFCSPLIDYVMVGLDILNMPNIE